MAGTVCINAAVALIGLIGTAQVLYSKPRPRIKTTIVMISRQRVYHVFYLIVFFPPSSETAGMPSYFRETPKLDTLSHNECVCPIYI